MQTVLTKAIKRGGVSSKETEKQLLKQFFQGCWDNVLIAGLQLEHKRDNPPLFPELLLQLRSEESKSMAKESRMRKHLGAHKPKIASQAASLCPTGNDPDLSTDDEVSELKKQVAKLQSQLTKHKTKPVEKSVPPQNSAVLDLKKQITELQSQFTKLNVKQNCQGSADGMRKESFHKPSSKGPPPTATKRALDRPRPGYCFHCGEDGYIALACNDVENPSLVASKRRQLRERHQLWDSQYSSDSLNEK